MSEGIHKLPFHYVPCGDAKGDTPIQKSSALEIFKQQFDLKEITTHQEFKRTYLFSRSVVILLETDTGLHAYSVKRSQAKLLQQNFTFNVQEKQRLDQTDKTMKVIFFRDIPKDHMTLISNLTELKTYGGGAFGSVEKQKIYNSSRRFGLWMKTQKVANKKFAETSDKKARPHEQKIADQLRGKGLKHVIAPIQAVGASNTVLMERGQGAIPNISGIHGYHNANPMDLCNCLIGALSGLQELETLDLLFTDLKFDNLLIDNRINWNSKLCDYGSMSHVDDISFTHSPLYTSYTKLYELKLLSNQLKEIKNDQSQHAETKDAVFNKAREYCVHQIGVMLLESMTTPKVLDQAALEPKNKTLCMNMKYVESSMNDLKRGFKLNSPNTIISQEDIKQLQAMHTKDINWNDKNYEDYVDHLFATPQPVEIIAILLGSTDKATKLMQEHPYIPEETLIEKFQALQHTHHDQNLVQLGIACIKGKIDYAQAIQQLEEAKKAYK